MEAVYQSSFEWLEFHNPTGSDYSSGVPDDREDEPERPEAFDVLMQLRRFNLSWSAGGYEDQPCLLYMELNSVCAAEEEHTNLKLINLRNKENAKQTI